MFSPFHRSPFCDVCAVMLNSLHLIEWHRRWYGFAQLVRCLFAFGWINSVTAEDTIKWIFVEFKEHSVGTEIVNSYACVTATLALYLLDGIFLTVATIKTSAAKYVYREKSAIVASRSCAFGDCLRITIICRLNEVPSRCSAKRAKRRQIKIMRALCETLWKLHEHFVRSMFISLHFSRMHILIALHKFTPNICQTLSSIRADEAAMKKCAKLSSTNRQSYLFWSLHFVGILCFFKHIVELIFHSIESLNRVQQRCQTRMKESHFWFSVLSIVIAHSVRFNLSGNDYWVFHRLFICSFRGCLKLKYVAMIVLLRLKLSRNNTCWKTHGSTSDISMAQRFHLSLNGE